MKTLETAALAAVSICAFLLLAFPVSAAECAPPMPLQSVRLAKVLDGDTITLDDGRHVRLIGVNTPERAHYGRREETGAGDATRFAQRFLGQGPLRIGIGQDPQDHYKRTLAHVFRADGRSLEEALLDAGLALQIVFPPNLSLAACFHAAEERARAARRGLWSEAALRVSGLREGEQGFRLLQGRVTRVARARSSWWIELEGRVSLRVDRSEWKHFPAGMPESLRGQTLEARGWLVWRSAKARNKDSFPPWTLRVRHPLAISVRPSA